jgi:hypothetical protein
MHVGNHAYIAACLVRIGQGLLHVCILVIIITIDFFILSEWRNVKNLNRYYFGAKHTHAGTQKDIHSRETKLDHTRSKC